MFLILILTSLRMVSADEIQGQPGPSGVPQRPFPPSPAEQSAYLGANRQVLARPRPGVLLALPFNMISISFRLIARVLGFAGTVLHAASERLLPRRVHRALAAFCRTLLPAPRLTDPRAAAADFIRSFNATYGERTPRWQIDGWETAAQKAQREGMFLFVYLHSHRHQDSEKFCRDTLCSPAFVDYVNSTFVSWGGDVRNPEAHRLALSLQVCKYPYCALLAFSGARTRLLTYTEGVVSPEALAEALQASFAEHEGILWEERLIQEQRNQDRRLREEQDAEYQRSLEADRSKQIERQRQEEQEQMMKREREEKERLEREMQNAIDRKKEEMKEIIANRRLEKGSILLIEPDADAEDICIIRVRFPTGETSQRRFKKHNEFEHVVNWVESLENNTFFKFSLATTYPRQVLAKEDYSMTLADLKFGKQIALAIQPDDDS